MKIFMTQPQEKVIFNRATEGSKEECLNSRNLREWTHPNSIQLLNKLRVVVALGASASKIS